MAIGHAIAAEDELMNAPRRSPKPNHASLRPVAPFPQELRHFAKAPRLKLLQNGL
jgi:hypothetical protein